MTKGAYEMRIGDWSPDMCASDLDQGKGGQGGVDRAGEGVAFLGIPVGQVIDIIAFRLGPIHDRPRPAKARLGAVRDVRREIAIVGQDGADDAPLPRSRSRSAGPKDRLAHAQSPPDANRRRSIPPAHPLAKSHTNQHPNPSDAPGNLY